MKITPIDDGRDYGAAPDRDRAKGGLPIQRLESWLRDAEQQPRWRQLADKCCAYYDDDQLSSRQLERYDDAEMDPRAMNLIRPVINSVLGQEAKSRRDPKPETDDDEFADVTDALGARLKESQRETNADMAISNAYASGVKAGIGWACVSRTSDPAEYRYRIEDVHRNSIWWDWRAKRLDLSDARWLIRRDWKDLDEVKAMFPEHAKTLDASREGWPEWLMEEFQDESIQARAHGDELAFSVPRSDWIDGARQRIRMYEVWYRVPAMAEFMRVGSRYVLWDRENPAHVQAAVRGLTQLERRPTMQVRRAMYAGPFRLLDEATTKKRFPYIPFFAFRTDRENTPYGMVHGMIAPQDDYNDRYMRIQWMLHAQQLIVDNDALDTKVNNIADVSARMMHPNMVAVLRGDRKNANGLQFRNDMGLQQQQYEVMQNAEALIQKTSGVFSAQLGQSGGTQSGLAINSLVEQGLTSMGELNDNYAFFRRAVYEANLDLIAEDHAERDMQVKIGTGQGRRVIVLNTVNKETGEPMNVVKDADIKIGLSEVPASPALQMQQSQQMAQMITALAGAPVVNVLLPNYIETNSAFGPNRKQMAEDARRMTGQPIGTDRNAVQAWQQQQQEAAAKAAQLQEANAQAALQRQAVDAEGVMAKTALTKAQAFKAAEEAKVLAQPERDALVDEIIYGTP